MQNLPFSLDTHNLTKILTLSGEWSYKSGKKQLNSLQKALVGVDNFSIDFSNVTKLDYFMAHAIKKLIHGKNVKFIGNNEKIGKIFEFISDENITKDFVPKSPQIGILAQIGHYFITGWGGVVGLATFLGEFFCANP